MAGWDDYRIFLAVAQAGSLSGAARRLGVAQPTIGRRVDHLEQHLQAKLFDRTGGGLNLTDAGRRIVALAEEMEHSAATIERRVSGEDTQLSGKVTISASDGLAIYWLAPRLAKLKQRHPGIDLGLIVDIRAVDVLRREADIAVRVGNPRSDELVGRCVGRVGYGLYGSKAYLQAYGTPTSLADLSNFTIIESLRELEQLPQVRELREAASGAFVGLRCNNLVAQLEAARAGLGLITLPDVIAQQAAELQRILPDEFWIENEVWVLTHRDLRQMARIRAVIDFLVEELRSDGDTVRPGPSAPGLAKPCEPAPATVPDPATAPNPVPDQH